MTGKYYLGFKGSNKQNIEYEIIQYKNNKNLTIRFLNDGTEVKTNGAYLSLGSPLHPTLNKPKIGDRFPCKDGDTVEIIEYISAVNCRIKWLSDGAEGSREMSAIREGVNKHPFNWKPKVGDVFKVTKGEVTVLSYNSAVDVDVQFQDGAITKTKSSCLKLGNVGHPTSCLVAGDIFKTNSGWEGVVLKYNSCHSVTVKWQDGSESEHPASHILNGGIKPLFQPSVAGVGFIGEGEFSSKAKKNKKSAPSVILEYWRRMLTRCFDPKEVVKQTSLNYLNVEVCNDWFNFQNFAKWALSQPNWNIKNELDKNLLGTGFMYSPESCTFLPMEVNVFLADNYTRDVHNLPKGVQYIKPATTGAKEGYVARCYVDDERKYLGYYDTPEEAFAIYKEVKEGYAKTLAERYKKCMTQAAYEKLLTFSITPYCSL
jgi:hypothetical protein